MLTLACFFASATLLAACGGDPKSPPPATTVTLNGVVADGPLSGASACYDTNDNGACDAGEPTSSTSDADGRFSLVIPEPDVGRHGIVVVVPATAVDKDTGTAVGTAFTLKTPATTSTTPFVSPLTTLVVDMAVSQGLSTTEAATAVQTQLGLTNSPLANFVAGADAQAGRFATTVNTVIIEVTKLADASPTAVSPEARQALIASVTTGDLKTIATLVNSAGTGTPAEVAAAVTQTVLEERNLSATTVAEQATFVLGTSVPPAPAAPGPFVSLRRFTYTDANNYQFQAFVGDSTPEANGTFKVSEVRANLVGGVNQAFNRNQVYWNKNSNTWEVCDRQWQIIVVTPAAPASGATPAKPQKSTFCGGSLSSTNESIEDVSGKKMADVVAAIRASTLADAPGFDTDAEGLPKLWGPDPALLGEDTFPPGSAFSKRVSASEVGDTERYSLTDKPRVIPASGTGTYRQAATFDDFKRMSGNLVNTAAVVSNLNTIFLDDLPAVQTDPLLSQIKRYRAAFDPAGNAVRYFACDVLASANTSQNCVALGDGISSITTRADSRVLRFDTGYPAALTTALARQRLFVERSGLVFGGAVDLERTRYQQRPNTVAWNALRTKLGIAEPTAPAAPAGPGPFETLRMWTYTDTQNYFFRLFTGDSSVLDAAGYFQVAEQRRNVVAGAVTPQARSALYWTGTEWFDCPIEATGFFSANSVAPRNSIYCKAFLDDRYNSATVTLDNRLMGDVLREIRWFSSKDSSFDYGNFGPNPDVHTALNTARFPAGATMEHRGNLRTGTPVSIFTGANSRVRVPPADASVPFDTWPFATSMDEFIAKNPGDLFGGAIDGSKAFFVQGYTLPAPPAPEYTTEVQIRVSFDANGNKARFYRNYRSVATGFTTAYVNLLDTTYTVETLGGKKVLRFAAMPDGFERDFHYQRMFAEHDGSVWYAGKDTTPATPIYSIRPNGIALRAIEAVLGVVR
jgi:trimeric autotransporter adhesin